MMKTSALDQVERFPPTKVGMSTKTSRTTAPARRRIRVGAYHERRRARVVTTRRSASLARGVTIKTMNKMTKGRPAERPESQVISAEYLVARAPAIPMTRPPTKVSGKLEK